MLAEVWAPPAGQHPALLYLTGLAATGRRSQRTGLEAIARMASRGLLGWNELPWHRIQYSEAKVILDWLRETYATPATANAYRAALRGVLKQCWLLGYLGGDDWMRIQSIKPAKGSRLSRGRDIETEELRRLFGLLAQEGTTVAARDAAWMAVAHASGGMRLEETLSLTMDSYQAGERSFRVVGKGNKEREIWLSDEAAEALGAWLLLRGNQPGPVFLAVARDRMTIRQGREMAPSTVREMCKRRARQAGIAHFSPHDLRRTSIGDVLDATGDLSLAADLAGHSSLDTTRRYDRRAANRKRAAARGLHVPYVAPAS
jgi:integrase